MSEPPTYDELAALPEQAWAAVDKARAERDRANEACDELYAMGVKALGERDRARATAVALEQDGAMAHYNLMHLAECVVAEVDHNATVYSKALAIVNSARWSA